ncbi:MAG TPA: toll/interleukin-1 receptor domain-containing protein [Pyrinomonadaceae bacterium]
MMMDEKKQSEAAVKPAVSEPEDYKYWAFISYSHKDEEWAKWLHKSLETYKIPKKMVGRETERGTIPKRVFPIFRDRDELPGAADLGGKLRNALRQSRNLIVICSPKSASSQWVNEEVRTYKALDREDRVFCLIVDGEPHASDQPGNGQEECFPPAVRFRVNEQGELSEERTEPIAADGRKGKDGRDNAKIKLLSGILGVGYDELRQREKQRQRVRRLRLAGGLASILLLVTVVYFGLADAGLRIPGGEMIRTFLDRNDISLFRHVHSDAEIRVAAAAMRQKLYQALRNGQAEGGWIASSLRPDTKRELEHWSNAQALTALFSVPDKQLGGQDLELRRFLPGLDAPFADGARIEKDGIKYGWVSHPGETHTQAEPALWTVLALTKALGRPGLLEGDARRRVEEHLAYTQEVLALYHPLEKGGWNMFPRQKEPAHHNIYSSALALLALLETRSAGLPWEGSVERRDQLLRDTAQWLIDQYDAQASPPGWHSTSESTYGTMDGITLQIYSELLRAELEAGIVLPPQMLSQIPKYLIDCGDRDLNFPVASGEFAETVTDPETGKESSDREAIGFLWYPWAISAASWWLRHAEKFGAPAEERVRVRRTLSNLVVKHGESAALKASSEWTFQAAETLYGLSAVAPP